MRNLKKFLALVLAMIMVAGATAVVSAADFEDVTADNAYAAAIDDLSDKGIVVGATETTFNPDADVQRYQMALLVARATTGKVGADADNGVWTNGIVPFTDVTQFKGAIQYAFVNGIIKGRTETTFDPAGNIAYVDALTMAVRALGYTDLEYPWGFYNKAAELGLTANIAIDDLYTTLNRAETAEIIYQMIYAKRADSNITFEAEYFDALDVVRSSDLFVITATPAQSYFGETTADVEEGKTLVAVQPLVNGVPSGDVAYIPVEDLGIEAADVEKYLNYAVELVDYDAAKGTYFEANLGAAPEKVYADDVEFDKDADTNNKISVAGNTYVLADDNTGRNALVAFAGAGVASTTDKVLTFLDDGVSVFYSGNVVATYAGKVSGVKYYKVENPAAGEDAYITEEAALALWGTEPAGVEYVNYTTIKAAAIKALGAFELQLFDDNNDGKFDRAIANDVYLSVSGTYKKDIDADKSGEEICDRLVKEHTGADVEAADVTYTEDIAAGTVFTYTFNAVTNTFDVIETFDYQTGKLVKTSTKDGRKLTFKTEDADVVLPVDKSAAADLGATVVDFGDALTLENIAKGEAFDVFTTTDWNDFFTTTALDKEYNFYVVNGNLIFAEEVPEEQVTESTAKIEFVVLDSVADYDFGAMDLNAYVDGELKVVALDKYGEDVLAELPNWYFGLFISDAEKFLKGSIYAVTTSAEGGINVIEQFTDEDIANDYVNAKGETLLYNLNLASPQVNNGVIAFENGIVKVGQDGATITDYGKRIRITDDTVIYVIDYGTGIENESDTEIKAYTGVDAKNAKITLDQHSQILIDTYGYAANVSEQKSSNLIIVVNAEFSLDGVVERDAEVTVFFTGVGTEYEASSAASLGLEGYGEGAVFYEYANSAINLKTGETVTIYSKTQLTTEKVCTLDENGVVVSGMDIATAVGAIDGLEDWSALADANKVKIEYFAGDKYYNIKLDDTLVGKEGDITKITLVNMSEEDMKLDHNGKVDNLTYTAKTTYNTWDKVVNFFNYTAQMENIEAYAVKISDNEYVLYVKAVEA